MAAGTLASAAGTNSASRNQGKAINQAANTQQEQINSKASQERFERRRAGMRERSAITVSAGEAGVAGGSVRNQLMDSLLQQGMDTTTIEGNRRNSIEASQSERNTRINSLDHKSFLETGLSIATSVAASDFGKNLFSTPKKIP